MAPPRLYCKEILYFITIHKKPTAQFTTMHFTVTIQKLPPKYIDEIQIKAVRKLTA